MVGVDCAHPSAAIRSESDNEAAIAPLVRMLEVFGKLGGGLIERANLDVVKKPDRLYKRPLALISR
jgi:hypothetical protein